MASPVFNLVQCFYSKQRNKRDDDRTQQIGPADSVPAEARGVDSPFSFYRASE